MRVQDIYYKSERDAYALGRNGVMHSKGLQILGCTDFITLAPLNTRGVGRAYLDIPVEDLDEVINALKVCKVYLQSALPQAKLS